jgi:hypothetical protein
MAQFAVPGVARRIIREESAFNRGQRWLREFWGILFV